MSPRVSILTLNPGFFDGPLGEGMIRIAREKGKVDVARIQIRDFATDRYGTTDDTPYGGGAGMVMKVDTIVRAFESARPESRATASMVIGRVARLEACSLGANRRSSIVRRVRSISRSSGTGAR